MILRNCCVPLFVAMASVHERVLAEHVLDRAPQRLAAVDHEQDRLLGIEATVDEVREQRPRQGRVLGIRIPGLPGRVLPEPLSRNAPNLRSGSDAPSDSGAHSHAGTPSLGT